MKVNYNIIAKVNQADNKTIHSKSVGEYDRDEMVDKILLGMVFVRYCDYLTDTIKKNKYDVTDYQCNSKNLEATITMSDGSSVEISVEAAQ